MTSFTHLVSQRSLWSPFCLLLAPQRDPGQISAHSLIKHVKLSSAPVYNTLITDRWLTFTIIIQQHIFWFEISVDDSFLMEVLQTLDDLSDVETGPGLLKPGIVLIHQVDVIPSWTRGQRSPNTNTQRSPQHICLARVQKIQHIA